MSRQSGAIFPSDVNRVKWFIFRHFERLLVVLLVASMLLIHAYIDHKVAFLSFYYLPIIAAGFYLGRHPAVWSAVLVVGLVVFFQLVVGLDGAAGQIGRASCGERVELSGGAGSLKKKKDGRLSRACIK